MRKARVVCAGFFLSGLDVPNHTPPWPPRSPIRASLPPPSRPPILSPGFPKACHPVGGAAAPRTLRGGGGGLHPNSRPRGLSLVPTRCGLSWCPPGVGHHGACPLGVGADEAFSIGRKQYDMLLNHSVYVGERCDWSAIRPNVLLRTVGRGAAFLGGRPDFPIFFPPCWESWSTGSHGLPVSRSRGIPIRPPTDLTAVVGSARADGRCEPRRLVVPVAVSFVGSWLSA